MARIVKVGNDRKGQAVGARQPFNDRAGPCRQNIDQRLLVLALCLLLNIGCKKLWRVFDARVPL